MFNSILRMIPLAAALVLSMVGTSAAQVGTEWARKMFDSEKIDFGVVATGSDAVQRVTIKNLYKETVHISKLGKTCGCSTLELSQYTLASGEVAVLEVTMDTRKFQHEKTSNAIITFDAPFPAEVRIPIRAYIRTDVVIEPGSAGFGSIERGAGAVRQLEIKYAGRSDWNIRDIRTSSKDVTAKFVETMREPGRAAYRLDIAVRPETPVGRLRELVTLVTDDSTNPHVPVMVEGIVEADITVTPSLVPLGQLRPGEQKTVRVVLRGKRPFEIEKIECEDFPDCFEVQLPKTRKQIHLIPLRVRPPETAGAFSDEFSVTIAGRAEPIRFRAAGTIGATATTIE